MRKRNWYRAIQYVRGCSDSGLCRARDILWTLTGRDVYRVFVHGRGWSPAEFEAHVGAMLVDLLLVPSNAAELHASPAGETELFLRYSGADQIVPQFPRLTRVKADLVAHSKCGARFRCIREALATRAPKLSCMMK